MKIKIAVLILFLMLLGGDCEMRKFILISPHQDDEWLAFANLMQRLSRDSQRRYNYELHVIVVTKSLWPDLESYDVRMAETAAAMKFLNVRVHYLSLTEEELFDPPYDFENYTGDQYEAEYAQILKNKILSISGTAETWVAFPSADDAACHPVHGFTRNIYTAVRLELSNVTREFEYLIYTTTHPEGYYYYLSDKSWKLGYFQYFYPTQWAVMEGEALEIVNFVSRFEHFKEVII